MDYINATNAAKKWGIGKRRVQYYCAHDKIPGAKQMGKQWIIPSDAPRPIDGRLRAARTQKDAEPYRFPILTFSRPIASDVGCSDEEKELLRAQTMYLTGDYTGSVQLCRDLIEQTTSVPVQFGALCTIAYDTILLGIGSALREVMEKMEQIAAESGSHQEDYRLILAIIRYHLDWSVEHLRAIDVQKISPDALLYYQAVCVMSSTVNLTQESENAVTVYEMLCRQAELEGILPVALMLHGVLAICCNPELHYDDHIRHVRAACDIALENGWQNYLSKFYSMISSSVDEYLKRKSPRTIETLKVAARRNVENWRLTIRESSNFLPLDGLTIEDAEILVLCTYGLPNKAIAKIKGISHIEAGTTLRELWIKLGLSSRKELIDYAKRQFAGVPRE